MKVNIFWKLGVILFCAILFVWLLSGCTAPQRLNYILTRNPHLLKKDSSEKIIKKDGEVTAPGFVINNRIPLDSLFKLLKENNNNPITVKTDKGELRYWINKAGELEQECISNEQKIRFQYEEREKFYQDTIMTEAKKEKIPWWLIALVIGEGVMIILLVIVIILLLIFRR